MAPSDVKSAASAVESAPYAEEEVISYSSLQRVNPNKEDRRRINLYLKQRMERLKAEGKIERAKCDVCMRLGHPYYACPYLRSVKEGTLLGPGWKIECKTCLEDDCLPGDKYVRRHAVKIYCAICCVSLMHSTIDCPDLTPEGRNNILKNAKRSKAMCEELALKRAALGMYSQ